MMVFSVFNRLYKLIAILSITGEYPMCSMELFGNKREYKKIVSKLTSVQTIRNADTKEEMTCKVLNVSGKGRLKTIRLNKNAMGILEWIDKGVLDYYMAAFNGHKFSGDEGHIRRNHRVAESVCLCMTAGVSVMPYNLYKLQNKEIRRTLPDSPSFYPARDIKRIGGNEMNKTMFTRLTGALFSYGRCYAVYNSRESVMKWSGMGEIKTVNNLMEICRYNSNIKTVDAAILMGESYEAAITTIMESDKNRRYEYRFDSIYNHIYFVPLNEYGIRQLKIMLLPDWNEKLSDLFFGDAYVRPEERTFEYDAFIDGKYIFSFLDGDVARLIRFREYVESDKSRKYELVCYVHQLEDVKRYMKDYCLYKMISIEKVENSLYYV